MFNKKYILWLVPIAILFIGCAIWNVTPMIFWEIALLLWFSIAPGYFLASAVVPYGSSISQRLTLSCALGMGMTVLVSMIMNALGVREYSAIVVSILGAITIAWRLISRRDLKQDPTPDSESAYVAWIAVVCCFLVLIYSFSGIHFTPDGSLEARGLFAIDVPYLIGNMPSLDIYGKMHDMHQDALWFPYHDYVYRFISVAHQIAGSDYFSLIAYSFPVYGSIFASLSLFSIFRTILDARSSFFATFACIVIASIWGDHLLTGALSPSYLAGIIYSAAIVLLIQRQHEAESMKLRFGIWILLGLSLGALAKTKLPLFAIVAASIEMISLLSLRKHRRTSPLVILACILSLVFGLKTSGSSIYQPAGDFVIAAPLMGYANQLAKLIHVHPATVDPIIAHFDFEIEDLLIPLYTIIHLLRMIALDPRLLLFVIALIATRKDASDRERVVKRFGMISVAIGLLLPILYSPAWYPLAISFYTPEIAGMCALICALLLILPRWLQLPSWTRTAAIACGLYGLVGTTLHLADAVTAKTYALSPDEVKATEWLRDHTNPQRVVATTRTDLDLSDTVNDESFYLYGALTQRRMISEGAKYGALLSAVADSDTVKGLHPVKAAQAQLALTRMTLALLNDTTASILRHGYRYQYYLSNGSQAPLSPHLEEVFRSGLVVVYRLRATPLIR